MYLDMLKTSTFYEILLHNLVIIILKQRNRYNEILASIKYHLDLEIV